MCSGACFLTISIVSAVLFLLGNTIPLAFNENWKGTVVEIISFVWGKLHPARVNATEG